MVESSQSAANGSIGSAQPRAAGLPLRKKVCYAGIICFGVLLSIEIAARVVSSRGDVQTRFTQIEQVLIHLGSDPGEIMFEADTERFW